MNISKLCFAIMQIMIFMLILSCSNNEDSHEKTVIRETTDKIAQDATKMITDPINRAKQVENMSNDRTRTLEQTTQQE